MYQYIVSFALAWYDYARKAPRGFIEPFLVQLTPDPTNPRCKGGACEAALRCIPIHHPCRL